MPSEECVAKQSAVRELLAQRIERFAKPDFMRRHLPLAAPSTQGADVRLSIVQNDGTGAATVEYETEAGIFVFGKFYQDASGAHAYQVQRALWGDGFGPESRYRVAEPLEFVPEYNLLLSRAGWRAFTSPDSGWAK